MARRLAAIMFTDLVGFTKLGQRDEERALRLRKEHQAILRPLFERYEGREVKGLGDGFLVEFRSAVESVRCAVAIQEALAAHNGRVGAEDRIHLRVGVHVGEVIEEGSDILGDAVNVASRIEPLAEPGGICISGAAYEQVRNKIAVPLVGLGPRSLKNVEYPVEVYRVQLGGTAVAGHPSPPSPTGNIRLAVLPFENLSAEPADGFFADGLTDELISRTAQIPGLRVIARTSVQRYKGSKAPVREVGQELGVGFALEGSVRKAGNRIRITALLVDTRSEEQLCATRYDRPLDDIFAIQDDISEQIARSIRTYLAGIETGAPKPRPVVIADTEDMEAYTLFLHGRQLLNEKGSVEGIRTALTLFESAVARDPNFARARVSIAETLVWLATDGSYPFDEAERRAEEELVRALQLNEALAEAHSTLALLYLGRDRYRDCEREAHRAVELNPSLSDPYRSLAQLAAGQGRIDEAVRLLKVAWELDPADVNILSFLGHALFYAGQETEALEFCERAKPRVRYRMSQSLAEHYLGKGDLTQAEAAVLEMERLRPESGWTLLYRGTLAARQGDFARARTNLERLRRKGAQGEMTVLFEGLLDLALGETDAFLACMEEALRRHTLPLLELLYSPLCREARGDPRLQDIILRQQRMTLPSATP